MANRTNNVISTGIIGYGSSGRQLHTPLLLDDPGFSLYAIATQTSSQSAYLPEDTIQLTPQLLINEPAIDLIVIATPNDTHYSYAKQALLAGKHVLVEKPLALKSEQIEELTQIAREQNKLLSTFHNRLWDCDYLAIEHLFKKETLGTIHSYVAQVNRYWPEVVENWRDNPEHGGAVWELAPNLLIQALVLFGKPNSLFADIATVRKDAKAADSFYIRLSYPSLNVELRSSSLVRFSGPRYLIHGDRGTYIKQGTDPQHQQLKDGLVPSDKKFGKEAIEDWGSLYTNSKDNNGETLCPSPAGNYPEFYRKIHRAITHNEPAPVSHDYALKVVKIIEAALQSNEQKKVVTLTDL